MARRLLLASLAAAGLLLTACTDDPSSAVVVGSLHYAPEDMTTRTSQLITELADAGATVSDTPLYRGVLNRLQLTDIVRSRLVDQAAAQAGVTASEADVDNALTQAGGETQAAATLVVPRADVRSAVRELLLVDQLAGKIDGATIQAPVVTVSFEGVVVSTRDAAVALRDKALHDTAGISAALAGAGQVQQGSVTSIDPSQLSAAQAGLFRAAKGDLFAVEQADGILLVHVLDRTTATTPVQVSTLTTSLQGLQVLEPLVLTAALAGNPVTVNPRYGSWDALTMNVVPDPDTV